MLGKKYVSMPRWSCDTVRRWTTFRQPNRCDPLPLLAKPSICSQSHQLTYRAHRTLFTAICGDERRNIPRWLCTYCALALSVHCTISNSTGTSTAAFASAEAPRCAHQQLWEPALTDIRKNLECSRPLWMRYNQNVLYTATIGRNRDLLDFWRCAADGICDEIW